MAIRRPLLSVTEARRLAGFGPGAPEEEMRAAVPVPEAAQLQTIAAPGARLVIPPRRQQEPKAQVFVSACLPASAVSPIFAMLCAHHRPGRALQMIMRRAFDDYEALLRDGSFAEHPAQYATLGAETGTESLVQTSRMMPVDLIEVARAHFDPLGFESARAFGHLLGTAALAAFFAKERQNGTPPRSKR